MNDVYNRFDRATGTISAYAILLRGEPVGRVVIKYGNACTAYVQAWGAPMVAYQVRGGGYDRASAAILRACESLSEAPDARDKLATEAWETLRACGRQWNGSERWQRTLENAGFTVATVIG